MMPEMSSAGSARRSSALSRSERSPSRGRRRHWLRRLGAAFALLAVAACTSSPTPYGVTSNGFGFSDQQLESNRYRVSFSGNSATSRDAVQDYALYRAAELTLANGDDYFKVVNRNADSRSSGVGGPRVGVGVGSGGSGSGLGVGLSTFLGGGGYGETYTVSLDILTFQGTKPAGEQDAYDAHEVLRRLEPSIQRPPA